MARRPTPPGDTDAVRNPTFRRASEVDDPTTAPRRPAVRCGTARHRRARPTPPMDSAHRPDHRGCERRFFRHPHRVPPHRPGIVVAPADGEIALVDKAAPPAELGLGTEPLPRVSIFLSVFDVHVQRVPAAGTVRSVVHQRGQFRSADLPEASDVNERNSVVIDTPEGKQVVVVQIAGLVARRIVCDAKPGDVLTSRRHLRADPVRLAPGHVFPPPEPNSSCKGASGPSVPKPCSPTCRHHDRTGRRHHDSTGRRHHDRTGRHTPAGGFVNARERPTRLLNTGPVRLLRASSPSSRCVRGCRR